MTNELKFINQKNAATIGKERLIDSRLDQLTDNQNRIIESSMGVVDLIKDQLLTVEHNEQRIKELKVSIYLLTALTVLSAASVVYFLLTS